MTTEINVDVKIEETEKEKIESAYKVLSRIECELSYLRDNGYYSSVDEVHLPQEIESIVEVSKKIYKLSWPGCEIREVFV